MRVISLETSLRQGSVAAFVGDGPRVDLQHELLLPADERSAQTLLPTIAELLKACHWQPADINLVCVTIGPGSFTGLRIGVTAAKTLAFAVHAQVVGVHTLAALAAGVPDRAGRLWTIMDAQRQELFVARFDDNLVRDTPVTRIVSVDAWLSQLRSGDTVVGPPLVQLADRLPPSVSVASPSYWRPQAGVAGRLGYASYREGRTVDPIQLVPNYYRKSAAEEKAAAKT